MFKVLLRRCIVILCGLVGCALFLHLASLPTQADAPQVQITSPMVNGMATGHPQTRVMINGSGFTPGSTINLYTTTSGDPTKCAAGGDPATNGLSPFSSSPTVMVQGDGTFSLQSTWPDNAATPSTPYYMCAISPTAQALSSNTFTVAQAVSINVTPTSVQPGGQVTVTGANWLPPQPLNVAVITGDNGTAPIVSNIVTPGNDGTFSVTLTIPTDAPANVYAVRVFATNENTMNAVQNNILTVTAAPTPTPTTAPTVAPSPTTPAQPTPVITPTPTTTAAPTTGGGLMTEIIYTLGGIGALFVVIGIVVFLIHARK